MNCEIIVLEGYIHASGRPTSPYVSFNIVSMHVSKLTHAKDYMVWHIALPCNFANASYVGVIQHAQVIERRHLDSNTVHTHWSRLKRSCHRVENPNYLAGS